MIRAAVNLNWAGSVAGGWAMGHVVFVRRVKEGRCEAADDTALTHGHIQITARGPG